MFFLTITAIQAGRKCKQWASDSVKNHRSPAQIQANPIRKSLGRVLIEILTDYFVDLSLLQAFCWRFEEYRKNGTSCSCLRLITIESCVKKLNGNLSYQNSFQPDPISMPEVIQKTVATVFIGTTFSTLIRQQTSPVPKIAKKAPRVPIIDEDKTKIRA